MSLFRLKEATLGYADCVVLRGVSLAIEPGERVAIVGPSGAGKTTLLRALYGQRRTGTALVHQDGALVRELSIFHNVYIGALDRHSALYSLCNLVRPWPQQITAVRSVLEEVALADKMFSLVAELSGGQRQRTAVSRALYRGGEVLLGDEPVSAVDQLQARQILAAVNRRFPSTVLVMHDVELAREFTTRLIGLGQGRILFDRPSADVTAEQLSHLYSTEAQSGAASASAVERRAPHS